MHPVLPTVACLQMCADVSSQETKGGWRAVGEGVKTNWIKTRSTHDLAHASQSFLSLKSQLGVCESISMRSLGFVVRCGEGVAESIKARPWIRGPRYQGYWTIALMSTSDAPLVTSGLAHIKHILSVRRRSETVHLTCFTLRHIEQAVPSVCTKFLFGVWSLRKEKKEKKKNENA